MNENNDFEWDEDDLHIQSRPLMLYDFLKLNSDIRKVMTFCEICPKEIQELLNPVINAAMDQCCNYAYELGFEDPNEIIPEEVRIFKFNSWKGKEE